MYNATNIKELILQYGETFSLIKFLYLNFAGISRHFLSFSIFALYSGVAIYTVIKYQSADSVAQILVGCRHREITQIINRGKSGDQSHHIPSNVSSPAIGANDLENIFPCNI